MRDWGREEGLREELGEGICQLERKKDVLRGEELGTGLNMTV